MDGHVARFEAAVQVDDGVADGYMRHHVVLPPDVAETWGAAGTTRLAGALDGVPFRRRLQRRSDGAACVMLGTGWLRDADPALDHAWSSLTPGRRRSLTYGIERAKRPATRERRAAEVAAAVRAESGL